MNTPRYAHVSCILKRNKLLVAGGIDNNYTQANNVAEVSLTNLVTDVKATTPRTQRERRRLAKYRIK